MRQPAGDPRAAAEPGGAPDRAVPADQVHQAPSAAPAGTAGAADARDPRGTYPEGGRGPAGAGGSNDTVAVVWSDGYLGYDLGGAHPLHPVRIDLTMRLARSAGLLDLPAVRRVEPEPADDALLELVHSASYVDAVRSAPARPGAPIGHGLDTPDNPVFPGMHESAALIAGGTVAAVREVWSGRARRAVNVGGGLHHAMADRASGFCVYNDVAIGIAWLLANGAKRVAYVDVDVHHGDGVQAAFYADPRVLTISLHRNPVLFFPETGFPAETGADDGVGTSVNVALPPGTDDAGWLRAFHAVVPGLLRRFEPEVLITQCGCDSHRDDPLADLGLSVDGQAASYAALRALAEELCSGRWVATGGGGYGLVRTVPRAWTRLIGELLGQPVDPDRPIPFDWTEQLRAMRLPVMPTTSWPGATDPPLIFGEGGVRGPDDYVAWQGESDHPVDRAVAASRSACFPLAGLDPDDPRD